jgi:tripartite-type tricarboxylate transporter receptor subunit TctC
VRLIVPFPAGGGVDFIGRIVGKGLSERLGQQVMIDNRPGANAILGLEVLKNAPADGYTIAAASAGPLTVNPHIYRKLSYDTLRDFTPISNMVNFPLLLVSHPSLPVKNVKELIALARARPGEITYSSPGAGNKERLAALPDFPTIAESGVPGYEGYAWGGMIGPANMPKDVVARLNREIVAILSQKDVIDTMLSQGTVPTPSSPEEFTAYMKSELKKWGDVVKLANIRTE